MPTLIPPGNLGPQGTPIKGRRPPRQPNPAPGSAGGLEGPYSIFVGGLPFHFRESQIRKLLECFGPLGGFNLVKDRETRKSKGYAFCVYQDHSATDIACAALNGMKFGDKILTVRRVQPKQIPESVRLFVQELQSAALATKVLCLTELVSEDELKDDEYYEGILEEIRTVGRNFGTLVNVVIPRPNPNGEPTPGVGKVFLEYADVDSARTARQGLNEREFGGNPVTVVYYPENKFSGGEYDG